MLIETPAISAPAMPKTVRSRLKSDYLVLPLLSLTTVAFMFVAAEAGSRVFWPAEETDTCLIKVASGDNRMKPNCTDRLKNAEGPWVTYHYNECGYRSYDSCGPKPAGTIRIALLGSSISQGFYIPYEQTFAQRTAAALSQRTGRGVQVQNMGVENLAPLYTAGRLDEALALKPDMVVYPIATYDLQQRLEAPDVAQMNDGAPGASPHAHVGPLKRLQGSINENSRAVLVAEHFFFADTDNYFRVHVRYGDNSNLFQQPLSSSWQARFDALEHLLSSMAARCRQAGVPLVIMAVPSRSQAILLDGAGQIPHTDPFAFSSLLKSMTTRLGCVYADAFYEFNRTPHSDKFFYSVDLHLDGEGHELLSRALIRKCLDGSIPALNASTRVTQ